MSNEAQYEKVRDDAYAEILRLENDLADAAIRVNDACDRKEWTDAKHAKNRVHDELEAAQQAFDDIVYGHMTVAPEWYAEFKRQASINVDAESEKERRLGA